MSLARNASASVSMRSRISASGARTRPTEKREAQPGAEPPGAVDDRADHHRRRSEAARDRLTLEARDHEPCDQRGEDGAEDRRGDDQPNPVQPREGGGEQRAPYAAPERDGHELR